MAVSSIDREKIFNVFATNRIVPLDIPQKSFEKLGVKIKFPKSNWGYNTFIFVIAHRYGISLVMCRTGQDGTGVLAGTNHLISTSSSINVSVDSTGDMNELTYEPSDSWNGFSVVVMVPTSLSNISASDFSYEFITPT